uniref:Reverse transcriptase zinc-binding domain-containing protein n=1 Tax=Amphiprion percula TaxID=161767 RepID=A0A3P8TZR2_AMPPE
MNILPKFLYLFQSVPVFIPKSYFDTLDSIISSYIWKGKRPRVSRTHLQKSKPNGGLALPNFRLYYWAANIRSLLYWANGRQTSSTSWLTMEVSSSQHIPLAALLGASYPLSVPHPITSPVIQQSLRVWTQFRKCLRLCSFSLQTPILSGCLFPPSSLDLAFKDWQVMGIKSFKDLFIDNNFASFDQLTNKFGIPRTHFFRYLQIRHFLQSQLPDFPEAPQSSVIDDILSLQPSGKGLISKIYSKLTDLNQVSTARIRAAWEQDLNQHLSDDAWDSILGLVNATSFCSRHSLLQFKVVHRAHMSKAKLSHIYPDVNPQCDKCGSDEATLIHSFWVCPRLRTYWQEVFQTLSVDLSILSIYLKIQTS